MSRTLVEPDFSKSSMISLKDTLPAVNHMQGKLVSFDAVEGQVETASGKHLTVKGDVTVLAIGDITALDEVKKAIYVIGHLKTVKKNIHKVLADKAPSAKYKAQTGNDIMVVTLGRTGGVAHIPVLGTLTANWLIKLIKSKDMLAGMYRKKGGAT